MVLNSSERAKTYLRDPPSRARSPRARLPFPASRRPRGLRAKTRLYRSFAPSRAQCPPGFTNLLAFLSASVMFIVAYTTAQPTAPMPVKNGHALGISRVSALRKLVFACGIVAARGFVRRARGRGRASVSAVFKTRRRARATTTPWRATTRARTITW